MLTTCFSVLKVIDIILPVNGENTALLKSGVSPRNAPFSILEPRLYGLLSEDSISITLIIRNTSHK